MVANFAAANVLLAAHIALDRVYTSAFVPLLIGIEGVLVAPTFFVVVHRLCRRLEKQFSRFVEEAASCSIVLNLFPVSQQCAPGSSNSNGYAVRVK